VLTVVSQGCATPSLAEPHCSQVTRAVLSSDTKGDPVTSEAVSSAATTISLLNRFGGVSPCSNLMSKFALADVERVRSANPKRNFAITTFSGETRLSTYIFKSFQSKQLGM